MLAVILNGLLGRLRALLRASFYVPVLINSALSALLFRMLFNRDSGALNWFLGLFGLEAVNWLYDGRYALWVMIAVGFWQWTGHTMVYLLAALQTVDPVLRGFLTVIQFMACLCDQAHRAPSSSPSGYDPCRRRRLISARAPGSERK